MNCANHPEAVAEAYCQYCGKPLCVGCIRQVNNVISCEPCMAARIHPVGASPAPGFPPAGFQPQPWGREPWLAAILGLIPGVGAMYNGQLAKGLAHVVIFALLVDLSNFNGALGILVAAWVFYQVFDAYQTAAARRDGLPLPNPLGLNDLGHWFGRGDHRPHPGTHPWPDDRGGPNAPTGTPTTVSADTPIPPIPPPYDGHDPWSSGRHGFPTGAIVLIILGIVFLLGNLGVLSLRWIDNGWPIVLIALGVWLLLRGKPTSPPGGTQ